MKVFTSVICNQVCVLIMNQDSATKVLDISFSGTYSGSNVQIKLNIPNVSWSSYNTTIGPEETMLLLFNTCGNGSNSLQRTIKYNESRCRNNQDTSQTVNYTATSCRCSKLAFGNHPTYKLRCADSHETGSEHYNSTTLSSDLTLNDSAFVTGDLTVPNGVSLTLDNVEVSFASGSKIVVQDGGKLTIQNSNLHGCDGGHWDGIKVNGSNSMSQLSIYQSLIDGAVNAVDATQTNDISITENAFVNGTNGVILDGVTGFDITDNDFVSLPVGIKTHITNAATSTINENLFYQSDTAIIFSRDDHSRLSFNCNSFANYTNYAIYSTQSTIKDQGSSTSGTGNYFTSTSTRDNHQLYATGTSTFAYYCDPSHSFTLLTSGSYIARTYTATNDGTCDQIEGRVANHGIIIPAVTTTSKSYLVNSIPNPTSGKTLFNYVLDPGAKNAEIKITNMYGQQVKTLTIQLDSRTLETDMSTSVNGLYFYTLYVNGNAVDSKKMVISK